MTLLQRMARRADEREREARRCFRAEATGDCPYGHDWTYPDEGPRRAYHRPSVPWRANLRARDETGRVVGR